MLLAIRYFMKLQFSAQQSKSGDLYLSIPASRGLVKDLMAGHAPSLSSLVLQELSDGYCSPLHALSQFYQPEMASSVGQKI
jgi:hypothetical protein